MRLLLVEDEDPKRDKISLFLRREISGLTITEARSVRSAVSAIKECSPDIILLDMSLPTFDITDEEPGGRPQGFGGKEIFRYLEKFNLHCPTIVVTGYEAFVNEANESVGLREMDMELSGKFPRSYFGIVYYNSLYGDWSLSLKSKIAEILREK